MYIGDTYPDENEHAFSLPQQYYIATFVGSSDPEKDAPLRQWTLNAYRKAETVSCGMYIADYDHTHRKTQVNSPLTYSHHLLISPPLGFDADSVGKVPANEEKV
jgi:hypothetical protein